MFRPIINYLIFPFFISSIFLGCNNPASTIQDDTVHIWEIDDPQGLNPLTSYDATSAYVKNHLFQRLLNYDYESYELIPVLAESRPEIAIQEDSTMSITYVIRKEAKWDNGTPISPDDVIFSIKAIMIPQLQTDHLKPYLSFINSFKKYGDEPQKLTLLTNRVHIRAEVNTGYEVPIIPEYFYDPDQVLRNYEISQLISDTSLNGDSLLAALSERLGSVSLNREPDSLIGSGAYKLVEWSTDERLVLERKQEWWGDKMDKGNLYFEAFPKRISYEIINDQTAAITAMKAGKLDVLRSIKAKDFKNDLSQNSNVLKQYNLFTPPTFGYSIIGINSRNPILRDKLTRQALAHLVNYNRLVKDILHGYGQRTVGPVPPFMKDFYNNELSLYQFEPETAAQLLKKAGWADSDGNGVLDREIDGKEYSFKISFLINKGQAEKEKIGLIYQNDLKKAGIELEIISVDWGLFNEMLFSYDFDLTHLALLGDPAPEDFSQLWHTSSSNGGFNFSNFGNATSDLMIGKINRTVDDTERAELIRELQSVIHDESPYIFLWNSQNRIAVHNRFSNPRASAFKPGYWTSGFFKE